MFRKESLIRSSVWSSLRTKEGRRRIKYLNTFDVESMTQGSSRGPCKVRNETETKRNETKQIETKRNKSKRNETDRNETKQIETKRNKSKRNETSFMERRINICILN